MKLSIIIITLILAASTLTVKSQDLSSFELKAHYPLNADGIDQTGNYDPIVLEKPVFSFGGILSRGCYVNSSNFGDSCLIETPEIIAMNDIAFAIQIDFRLSSLGKPIIIAGHGYRYLGLETHNDGQLFLRTGSGGSGENDIEDVFLEQDQWYTATLIHNTVDSVTHVFLDGELIFAKKKFLNHPDDDNEISNSNFSSGRAYFGYWKDLKVYSTDSPSAIENVKEKDNHIDLIVSPNPATDILQVHVQDVQNLHYKIFDISGRAIQYSQLQGNTINIKSLPIGSYVLAVYSQDEFIGSRKFVKF